MTAWDPDHTAAYYDAFGEREWTRFEDGLTPRVSLAVHLHHLRRFAEPGDRVLDVGAGPGRFTIELARLGAEVVVADISPAQLELNRERVKEAGLEKQVTDRVVADVLDLSRWSDGAFDATVCYGGALSYVLERAPEAAAELARVTRPGGHVLVSVMSLVGTVLQFMEGLLDLARRDGVPFQEEIVATGFLPERGKDYGHLPMTLYRWPQLQELLAPHGEIVAASAAGLLASVDPAEPELRDLLARWEVDLAADPGALSCGQHILAVVRKPS
jgi:ubiquinone/menaquinone biosynthesis C-methylase UbiE